MKFYRTLKSKQRTEFYDYMSKQHNVNRNNLCTLGGTLATMLTSFL